MVAEGWKGEPGETWDPRQLMSKLRLLPLLAAALGCKMKLWAYRGTEVLADMSEPASDVLEDEDDRSCLEIDPARDAGSLVTPPAE